ncbi:hypothetical protein H4S00_001262 [Coemansia sp. D1744]|nr:hypothetical protein IWW49_000919 [Coemansia sp. RSA 1797]KAJ2727950.1 hypothetical protein H4S00_001262 [Coemansia sp. D1744]
MTALSLTLDPLLALPITPVKQTHDLGVDNMTESAIPCTANSASAGSGQGMDCLGFGRLGYASSSDVVSPNSASDASARASDDGPQTPSLPTNNVQPTDSEPGHDPQPTDHTNEQTTQPITSTSVSAADLESSLLLKPFTGFSETTDPAASMATPQSLQDGSSLSPLEMLIAALDPQKQAQPVKCEMETNRLNALDGFWNPAHTQGKGMWDAGQPSDAGLLGGSSDAGLLGGYQIGHDLGRKGSYPPGVKRPFSDFDQLLSAADMYGGQSKHVRHDSLVDDTCSVDTAANAMPYTSAFSSTVPQSTGMAYGQDMGQAQALNPCFDQLSQGPGLSLGIPLISQPQMSHMQLAQSLSMANPPIPYHSRSLSLSHVDHSMMPLQSPMAVGANRHPALGYFYDSFGAPSDEFVSAPMPIPSIPGVTVSPATKPRRVSVPDLTPTIEEKRIGSKALPRRQKVRFGEDLYTPTWVRGQGQQKEGFCDTCLPGKWLQLKNSAFWYHKQFLHGISSVSGRPFIRPVQVRHFDADIIEGLCHQCHQWVPIANAKRRNSVLWFRHAHKCHVYHKPKNECEFGEYPVVDSGAMLDVQSPVDHLSSS